MRKIFCFSAILLFVSTSISFAQNGHYMPAGIDLHAPGNNPWGDGDWTLVFEDEFNYSGVPDPDKWETRDYGRDVAGGNGGAVSVYRSSNVLVQNGNCNIVVRKEGVAGKGGDKGEPRSHYDYTSGEIRTLFENKGWQSINFTEGMFEARIKMCGAFWSHNNFWLLGGNREYDGDGEIDIAEFRPSIAQGFVGGRRQMPHRVHRYKDVCNNGGTDECGTNSTSFSRFNNDFHVYTCIWDKYYIYFYIDHVEKFRIDRFLYATTNNDASASIFDLGQNNYTTKAGYYWNRGCFIPTNAQLYLSFHLFLDKAIGNSIKRGLHKQAAGLPATLKIDWVKVYVRKDCGDNEAIANSALLPFRDTKRFRDLDASGSVLDDDYDHRARHLTIGTQNTFTNWENIGAPWGTTARYKAETITLLPNYICYPEWVEEEPCPVDQKPWTRKLSSTLFVANQCPSESSGYQNEYVEIEIPEYDSIDIDTFNCADVNTNWVDSTINASLIAGDTLYADSIISYLVDSLGCEYWGNEGGSNKPGKMNNSKNVHEIERIISQKDGDIHIRPNPNKGLFTIRLPQKGDYRLRIVNAIGSVVYQDQISNELRKTIHLDHNLPAGNYIIQIVGARISYTEKVILTK